MAPGFVLQGFRVDSVGCTAYVDGAPCAPLLRQSWVYLGPSFDIGGQALLPWGTVVTSTVGAMVRIPTISIDESQLPGDWRVYNGQGLHFRWSFSIGWALP